MPQTVKRFSLWSSWNHEGEEAWLDKMSAQGLHLERACLFWSTFTSDPAVRYVYRLDYQSGLLGTGKSHEYIGLYADAGWEYMCTFLGRWHYFRQPWKAGEHQELYTDRASLRQLYQRILQILAVAFFVNVPGTLMNLYNLENTRLWDDGAPLTASVAAMLVLQATALFLTGYGVVRMRRKVKNLSPGE